MDAAKLEQWAATLKDTVETIISANDYSEECGVLLVLAGEIKGAATAMKNHVDLQTPSD